ncbi:hypothetical protein LY78DRAFT_342986 [Colletotrichum sublineola]|nr:hypothetical protein LY78DRAFT_342986 [Colletotrichum sublineola]
MSRKLCILFSLLSVFSLIRCDDLDYLGYTVVQNGNNWQVYRNNGLINELSIDEDRHRIKIHKAWNKYDPEPRAKLSDVMVYIWNRAGYRLSSLQSVQVVDLNNRETQWAISNARKSAGVQHPRDFTLIPGGRGWLSLATSPFYNYLNEGYECRGESRRSSLTYLIRTCDVLCGTSSLLSRGPATYVGIWVSIRVYVAPILPHIPFI